MKTIFSILLQLGIGIGLSVGAMVIFSILRRKDAIVYMPRRPPELGNGFFSGLRTVIRTTEAELLNNIGLDAVIFLRLLKICRWTCGLLALLACIMLIPCDLFIQSHSTHEPTSDSHLATVWDDEPGLSWLVVFTIDGNWLYAHLLYGYLATFIVLYMIYVNYKSVISLKWKWLRSPEYQSSILSRSIMLTHIDRRYLLDERLEQLFAKLPIKCTAVYFGQRVGILPYLIRRHNENVRKLEKVLVSYLKVNSPSKRSTICVRNGLACVWGGREDAIQFYTQKILHYKREIRKERHQISRYEPESYAFASFPTVSDAHMVAKQLNDKKIDEVSISLAPPPRDMIWENLTKSHWTIVFQRSLVKVLIVLFGILYTIPLAPFIWNFIGVLQIGEITPKSSKNPKYVILSVATLLLTHLYQLIPIAVFHKLGSFKGAVTQQQLERAVLSGYFGFLTAFHFMTLSGLGFVVYNALNHHYSTLVIVIWYLAEIELSFMYWITWFPLKIFTRVIDLVQIFSLISSVRFKLWKNCRTPREIRELTKPSEFDYSLHMANVLFMLLVALIFAPLIPLVTPFATAVFYVNSWLYKYQLMYLSTTKCETGGRLWQMLINRILFSLIVMLVFLCLVLGAQLGWVQSLATLPPIGIVIAFKYFLKLRFETRFKWYTPKGDELSQLHRHEDDTQKDQLEKQFGHPLLHEELLTPMVHQDQEANLSRVYLDSQVGTDEIAEEAEDPATFIGVPSEMDCLEGGTDDTVLAFKDELPKERRVQHGGLAFCLVSKNDLNYTHGEFICQRDRASSVYPSVLPTTCLESIHPAPTTPAPSDNNVASCIFHHAGRIGAWPLPLHGSPGYTRSSHDPSNNIRIDSQGFTQEGPLE